jgi:hypothetical protein
MDWTRMLAYITGSVDQELLLRNEIHHLIAAADCGYALRRSGTIPRAAG